MKSWRHAAINSLADVLTLLKNLFAIPQSWLNRMSYDFHFLPNICQKLLKHAASWFIDVKWINTKFHLLFMGNRNCVMCSMRQLNGEEDEAGTQPDVFRNWNVETAADKLLRSSLIVLSRSVDASKAIECQRLWP